MERGGGDFDYSIANKEVEIRNFTGVPMDARQLKEVGEVQVEHARVRFDNSREDKLVSWSYAPRRGLGNLMR